MKDIKPVMYQKFINQLAAKGYSKQTIEIIHGTIYNAFEKAVTLGKSQKNPCVGVMMKGKQKEHEVKFIESEHIGDFLQAAYEYGYVY
ncbi:integrase [Peribacillus asahii]|uniref:integrase n=1 Tax=Peribacillus asahii TaxID=228899 RepID=UPI00380CEF19